MKHAIRPAARDDILRQFRYYLVEEAYQAAFRFLDAIEVSTKALCRRPRAGSPRLVENPALAGLRSWPVKGFEEVRIYYLVRDRSVLIIRVLHGRRDVAKILGAETVD